MNCKLVYTATKVRVTEIILTRTYLIQIEKIVLIFSETNYVLTSVIVLTSQLCALLHSLYLNLTFYFFLFADLFPKPYDDTKANSNTEQSQRNKTQNTLLSKLDKICSVNNQYNGAVERHHTAGPQRRSVMMYNKQIVCRSVSSTGN